MTVHRDDVSVTSHARERWLRRSSDLFLGANYPLDDSVDDTVDDVIRAIICDAWREAKPFPVGDYPADEARYHPRAEVVLFRRESAVVTVYTVTGLRRDVRKRLDDLDGVDVSGGGRRVY